MVKNCINIRYLKILISSQFFRTERGDLIRFPESRIPGELATVTGIVVAGSVGHQHHDNAAIAQHLGDPKFTIIAVVLTITVSPKSVVVFASASPVYATVPGIALQGLGQQTGMQDLFASDHAAVDI